MTTVYTGSVTYTAYLPDIDHPTRTANVPFSYTFPNFADFPVTWTSTVPSSLKTVLLGILINNKVYNTTLSTSVTFTGYQYYTANTTDSQTQATYVDNGGRTASDTYIVMTNGNYNSTTNLNDLNPQFTILTSVNGTNIQIDDNHYPAQTLRIAVNISISASILCNGNNLKTSECESLCSNGNTACLDAYIDYCFPNVVGIDTDCQSYFADYIANNGPNTTIDENLTTYCTGKYKGFGDLFGGTNETDIELCACHLEDQQYTNFYNQITQQVPALTAYPQIDRCFVPKCVSSKYHSQPIPKGGCQVPQCVSIGVFNNDGTYSDSSINENVSGCGGGPSDIKIAEIAIFVVIIFIIIIAIISWLYYNYE